MPAKSAEDSPPTTRYQPTTPDQQARFIAGMLEHSNLARATRDAGIGSRTTGYRLWRRFQATGEAVLPPRSHARTSQAQITATLAPEVEATRDAHPLWGRRRIARELAAQHGHQVISPSGVQAVLEQAGLWTPAGWLPTTAAPRLSGPTPLPPPALDRDQLVHQAQQGIIRDLQHDPGGAIALLRGEVWDVLATDPSRRAAVLRDPEAGGWLLRSLPFLAHALIDTGQWYLASRYLLFAHSWLSTHPPTPRQAIYQAQALFSTTSASHQWQPVTASHPPLVGVISLSQGDTWVECCQYLGVVLRDEPGGDAQRYLRAALRAFAWKSRRPVQESKREGYLGVIEHDLGALMLRLTRRHEIDADPAAIARHLDRAEALLDQAGSLGMLAATHTAKARLQSFQAELARGHDQRRWQVALAAMAEELDRARSLLDQESSPILRTTAALDATELLVTHGMVRDIDSDQLRQAARDCLEHGYRHQAHRLISLADRDHLMPPEVQAALARLVAADRTT